MNLDAYFSADVETDGPIPGPYSMLSFAIVFAGNYDGSTFHRPDRYDNFIYRELRPISPAFQPEALAVNGINRDRLLKEGQEPEKVMSEAADWIRTAAGQAKPVLVAYPLSFDWSWLYWYFTQYSITGSPFSYSQCYDIKTAVSVKTRRPIAASGRAKLPHFLLSHRLHTHHALDDAIEQAEIFANVFEWPGDHDGNRKKEVIHEGPRRTAPPRVR